MMEGRTARSNKDEGDGDNTGIRKARLTTKPGFTHAIPRGFTTEFKSLDEDTCPVDSETDAWRSEEECDEVEGALQFIHENLTYQDTVDSWNFDVLHLNEDQKGMLVHYVLFNSRSWPKGFTPGAEWIDEATFERFRAKVGGQYLENPYHNYTHGVCVFHVVHLMLLNGNSEAWLSSLMQYALLVAALCHDIGHPGRSNQFLVDMRHEWAIRYNDRSPLENMHCASLFSICGDPALDVFKNVGEDFKVVRKVCIETILHTDQALHDSMVNELLQVYSKEADICDKQAKEPEEFVEEYLERVLKKSTFLFLKLFLHFSDLAHIFRPYDLCKKWVEGLYKEFFEQGDEDRAMGRPVPPFLDRNKTSIAGGQHMFVKLTIYPMVKATCMIFQAFHHQAWQLLKNTEHYQALWLESGVYTDEDVQRRDVDLKTMTDEIRRLCARTRMQRVTVCEDGRNMDPRATGANTHPSQYSSARGPRKTVRSMRSGKSVKSVRTNKSTKTVNSRVQFSPRDAELDVV